MNEKEEEEGEKKSHPRFHNPEINIFMYVALAFVYYVKFGIILFVLLPNFLFKLP